MGGQPLPPLGPSGNIRRFLTKWIRNVRRFFEVFWEGFGAQFGVQTRSRIHENQRSILNRFWGGFQKVLGLILGRLRHQKNNERQWSLALVRHYESIGLASIIKGLGLYSTFKKLPKFISTNEKKQLQTSTKKRE